MRDVTLVKILIGVAWIDGKLQPEERQYLHALAEKKGVASDREIQPILYELRSVKPEDCYQWIQDYLGNAPDAEACQNLIESISTLIYQDGIMSSEEAKLLTRLQLLESEPARSRFSKMIDAICQLYQQGLGRIERL